MRKTLYILFILVYQATFSQQIENIEISLFNEKIFENDIKEKSIVDVEQSTTLFPEIIKLELKDIKNNSEGKFSLNNTNKKYFTEEKVESSIFNQNNETKKPEFTKNLSPNVKKKFVNTIIRKKIAEEIEKYMLMNEALTYGDRNIEYYRNYIVSENKLIIATPITSEIDIQIGKDIYPYLNKISKTELDKTLQNSLNLLVINF